jgi:hypothetical protein
MKYSRIAKVLMVGAIAAGLTACEASKVSQCNSLSTLINKGKARADKFEQTGKDFEKKVQAVQSKQDVGQLQSNLKEFAGNVRAFSKDVDGLGKEIEGVSLKDETLVGIRTQYLKMLTGLNQEISGQATNLDAMSTAKLDTPAGQAEFDKAGKALGSSKASAVTRQESEVVNRFNTYCAAK